MPAEATYESQPTQSPQVSIMAALALICAFVLWPVGLILGYVARKEIDNSNGQKTGRGMATAAIVLGWLGVIATVIIIGLLVAGAIGSVPSNTNNYDPSLPPVVITDQP